MPCKPLPYKAFRLENHGQAPSAAYLRTSSAANVGRDKDSEVRERSAIASHAKAAGLTIAAGFYDAAPSGADPVAGRKGFAALLAWCRDTGCRTIVVENASRFARHLIVQETGHALLKAQGISLIAADDPDAVTADTPTSRLIQQILGAVSEFEKAGLVAKFRGARDRKSAAIGRRVEGRRGHAETNPALVREARRLARKSPATGQGRSLRRIAAELHALGFTTSKGTRFTAAGVQSLLDAKPPRPWAVAKTEATAAAPP